MSIMNKKSERFWKHLPNAHQIGRVAGSLVRNEGEWNEVWFELFEDNYEAQGKSSTALVAAEAECIRRGLDKEWWKVYNWKMCYGEFEQLACSEGWKTVAALIAWDHSKDLLKMKSRDLKKMVDNGDHAAILIYPCVRVKELVKG